MVDLEALKKAGYSPEALKAKFTAEQLDEKTNELVKLNAARIRNGIQHSLDASRAWFAIDNAFDVPHQQITYSMVRGLLLNREPNAEVVLKAASDWGLTTMLTNIRSQDGKYVTDNRGQPVKKLQLPVFFNVFVPVVMAYTKIRWGRLFAERDENPFYKFDPAKLTIKSKLKCNLITDRIQMMTDQMGYRSDERQSILQSLLYSHCINFPREPWYKEEQVWDGKKKVVKEGVRFEIPHPSRTFWDRSNTLASLNTDTGIEYLGYWDVTRWSNVMGQRSQYWNLDKVTYGTDSYQWGTSSAFGIYQELYQCVMKWPAVPTRESETDRKVSAFKYLGEQEDYPVSITPIFHKLIPKDWGLYDYDHPVWHRFIYSNENTVIHAVPFTYTPGVVYLYDNDTNRAINSSLGLELVPWQDHLGNYLTQYLLSVKQNLANLVLANEDLLTPETLASIRNLGEDMYRALNLVGYSEKDNRFAMAGNTQEALRKFNLNVHNVNEIGNAIMMMLNVMERMLGYSPQELGAASSHEQSATEMGVIAGSQSIRMQFTGGFLDDGRHAKKNLLYNAMMTHSDDEIFAQVAEMNDVKKAALTEMGFKVEEAETADTNAGVRGEKKGLMMLEGFASSKDGPKRVVDRKIAELMLQMFQSIFSNPTIVEAQGMDNLVKMLNEILLLIGVPNDFRIKLDGKAAGPQQAQAVQEQIAQIAAQVSQAVVQKEMAGLGEALKANVIDPIQQQLEQIAQALAMLSQKDQQQDAQIAQTQEALNQAVQETAAILQSAAQPQPMM